jgi:short-subunit dehydrogenase
LPTAPFADRYGPWALVAGASSGIGAAFARQLASRGLHLVLVARRAAELDALAEALGAANGIETLRLVGDLADPACPTAIFEATADRDVGLLVYNAALSLLGPFLDHDVDAHLRELDTNVRAPMRLAHHFGREMRERRRGGIILMSSLAGLQGGPYIANYAATKAYNLVLAEGMWAELRHDGVDVLACCAGATATDAYLTRIGSRPTSRFAPPLMSADAVAAEALDAVGKRPSHVTGMANRIGALLLQRLLPRAATVRLMERNTRRFGATSVSASPSSASPTSRSGDRSSAP